jgi:hypothetical protein
MAKLVALAILKDHGWNLGNGRGERVRSKALYLLAMSYIQLKSNNN